MKIPFTGILTVSIGGGGKTSTKGPFSDWSAGTKTADRCAGLQVGPNSFELVNLLGRGSFGEVFQVKHKRTGKAYAMKALVS